MPATRRCRITNTIAFETDGCRPWAAFVSGVLDAFGDFWIFAAHTVRYSPLTLLRRRDLQRFLPQCHAIGTLSVPVILITGVFVGMVLAIQAIEQFMSVGLADRMGVIVSLSVVRELGPVLAGVMLAGRVGGALAAELGTMNVTEQLDALRSMGTDPIRVLVAPRFLACVLLTPVLTLYCDLMGVCGGWLICVPIFDIPNDVYWDYTAAALESMGRRLRPAQERVLRGLHRPDLLLQRLQLQARRRRRRQGLHRIVRRRLRRDPDSRLLPGLRLKGMYESIWGFKSVF